MSPFRTGKCRAGRSRTIAARARPIRTHTVIAVDAQGTVRVVVRLLSQRAQLPRRAEGRDRWLSSCSACSLARAHLPTDRGEPFPIVSDRERIAPAMARCIPSISSRCSAVSSAKSVASPRSPAEKWRGGTLVLRPGTPGLQEKSLPIETFFHKIVMLRNRLRSLEQQVNAAELPEDVKLKLQGYVTGCYGSLTSFNVLFADEDDQFKGAGGD